MNKTSWVVCQALLLKCSPEKRRALLKFLPATKQRELQETPPPHTDPLQHPHVLEDQLSLVHPSWIAPFLRTLAENEIRLFLSALTPLHAKELQKTLLFTNHLAELTPVAKDYLQKTLWATLGGNEQLPLTCLPESSFNRLLNLENDKFNTLIFLLGLHDLAHEMRHIIETAKLKKIQTALRPDELSFLKSFMQKKEAVTFKKISLSEWNGDEKALRKILQGRGLNRLAKALYGKSASLAWYLAHRMDMEMAKQFYKLSTPLDLPRAQEVLLSQVEEALTYLQTHTLR